VAPARPEGLAGPRGGTPDDLKLIKGVGAKLEKVLHGLGIYHYEQIAGWGPAEVVWIDGNLEGFRGRASRDGWVGQAQSLLEEGSTPHAREDTTEDD
jgi:NADH-quinone oxidoreductase subunit E